MNTVLKSIAHSFVLLLLVSLIAGCSSAGSGDSSSSSNQRTPAGTQTGSGALVFDGTQVATFVYGDVYYYAGGLDISLLSAEWNAEEYDLVWFELFTDDTSLQPGTYAVDLDAYAGETIAGGEVCLDVSPATVDGTYFGDVQSGQLVVEKSGANYILTFEITSVDQIDGETAHTVAGSYEGTLPHYPYQE